MRDQCLAFLEKAHPDRCCRNQSAEYTPAVAEMYSSFTPLEKPRVSDFKLHILKIHRGTKAKVQKLQVPLGSQHQVVRLQVTWNTAEALKARSNNFHGSQYLLCTIVCEYDLVIICHHQVPSRLKTQNALTRQKRKAFTRYSEFHPRGGVWSHIGGWHLLPGSTLPCRIWFRKWRVYSSSPCRRRSPHLQQAGCKRLLALPRMTKARIKKEALHELHDQVEVCRILECAKKIGEPKPTALGHCISFVVCLTHWGCGSLTCAVHTNSGWLMLILFGSLR